MIGAAPTGEWRTICRVRGMPTRSLHARGAGASAPGRKRDRDRRQIWHGPSTPSSEANFDVYKGEYRTETRRVTLSDVAAPVTARCPPARSGARRPRSVATPAGGRMGCAMRGGRCVRGLHGVGRRIARQCAVIHESRRAATSPRWRTQPARPLRRCGGR